MDSEIFVYCVIGFFVGWALCGILFISMEFDIRLDQETGNDICVNLTGNQNAIASDTSHDGVQGNGGKLICEFPSFDSTTNIIVKGAGE